MPQEFSEMSDRQKEVKAQALLEDSFFNGVLDEVKKARVNLGTFDNNPENAREHWLYLRAVEDIRSELTALAPKSTGR